MRRSDLHFANDPRGAVEAESHNGTWLVLAVVGLVIGATVAWAYWARVDQVTNATGRVIASQQNQTVESLEPGIVADILVAEGDQVKAGQELVRIDDTGASSRLGELNSREASLTAELLRLRTHAQDKSKFVIPENLSPEVRRFYVDQGAAFQAQLRKLEEAERVRKRQLLQKQQSRTEIQAKISQNQRLLGLSNKELKLMKRLYSRKAITQIELLRIQKEAAQISGDVAVAKATKLRLEAEIAEAEALLGSEKTTFLADVSNRISSISGDLGIVKETKRAASDVVRRTVLRSPVDGIVNKLSVASINEVVAAGVSVAEIVPVDDKLLIEARVRPEDIGFISPGLDATIRISAYDYTKYGTLDGRVARIGSDTITDDNQETFYQVIIETLGDPQGEQASKLDIIPGMIAIVDIQTGDRSVLEYLMKPVLVVKDRALRDPR